MNRPTAYTGPYPIRDHATLADLRYDQDDADSEHARQILRALRGEEDDGGHLLGLILAAMSGAVAMLALCLFFAPMLGAGQ